MYEYLGKELLVDFVFLGTVKLWERFGATEHLVGTEMQKSGRYGRIYIYAIFPKQC